MLAGTPDWNSSHRLEKPWCQYVCEFVKDVCSYGHTGILHHSLPTPTSSFCSISSRLRLSYCLMSQFWFKSVTTQMWIQPPPECPTSSPINRTRTTYVAKTHRSSSKAFHSNKASNWNSIIRCACFSKAPWLLPDSGLQPPAGLGFAPLFFYFQLHCSL